MTHNYQFASIADNTHGPISTNIEISEQVKYLITIMS